MKKFSRGISVVVATKDGAERLPALLRSFECQTLDPKLWEAVFVINGQDDGSSSLITSWANRTGHNCRIQFLRTPSAGAARNLGLASVGREYTTFVDDDDWLEEEFLELGLRLAAPMKVVLLPIKEVRGGAISSANSLEVRRRSILRGTTKLFDLPWVLGFNSCKVVSSALIDKYRYDPTLRSGEDVAFFANLLQHPELEVTTPEDPRNCAYIRSVRNNSVSRREKDFDFAVTQRLQVIAKLQKLDLQGAARQAARSLELSQFQFVGERLRNHPGELSAAADEALRLGLRSLPWEQAHASSSPKQLVISYCFPPFADPAANVIAKRIATAAEPVDVVSADMSPVRGIDCSAALLVEPWVNTHWVVEGYPSFSSWPHIANFARKAVRQARQDYERLYTRALWSGSHAAGALYKLKRPSVYWEAEFSDPLRFGVDGVERERTRAKGSLARAFRREITKQGWSRELHEGHFALTELITLLLADRIIFPNANQAEIVLGEYSAEFRSTVKGKVAINSQPVPPASAYLSSSFKLDVDPSLINIGFFGRFYENRGLGDYKAAMDMLSPEEASKFCLHVFSTGGADESTQMLVERGYLVFHEAVDYLDFLAATTQMDVLLVTDTKTQSSEFEKNPYLPSKLSDYLGAGVDIWALTEAGSPLSQISTAFRSNLDVIEESAEQLRWMIKKKIDEG